MVGTAVQRRDGSDNGMAGADGDTYPRGICPVLLGSLALVIGASLSLYRGVKSKTRNASVSPSNGTTSISCITKPL